MITSVFVKGSLGLERKPTGLVGQNPNCCVFMKMGEKIVEALSSKGGPFEHYKS